MSAPSDEQIEAAAKAVCENFPADKASQEFAAVHAHEIASAVLAAAGSGGVLTDQLASVREVAFQGPTEEELKAWRNTSLSMGDGMTAMLAMIVANVRAVLVSYEAQTAENAAP